MMIVLLVVGLIVGAVAALAGVFLVGIAIAVAVVKSKIEEISQMGQERLWAEAKKRGFKGDKQLKTVEDHYREFF